MCVCVWGEGEGVGVGVGVGVGGCGGVGVWVCVLCVLCVLCVVCVVCVVCCVCGCVGCVGACVGAVACRAVLLVGISIPSCPMLFVKEPRKDIRLYVRRVFIMDDYDELIPEWFEFCESYVVNSEALFFNILRHAELVCKASCHPATSSSRTRVSSPQTRAHS